MNKMIKVNKNDIKEIDVNNVSDWINERFDFWDSKEGKKLDWEFENVYNGEGIYELEIGSRGVLEDICKNDEYESLEYMNKKEKDYDSDFYYVDDSNDDYIEYGLYEEYSGVFFNVVGEWLVDGK
jgi:hypothetical protein